MSVMARTTRYTDGKLPNHGKKCEDRCSHFVKKRWNRLLLFLNERYDFRLSILSRFKTPPWKFGPDIGLARKWVEKVSTSTSSFLLDKKWSWQQLIPNIFSDYDSGIINGPIQVDSDVKTVSSRAEGHQKQHFWSWKWRKMVEINR